jgi:hypothetical protein
MTAGLIPCKENDRKRMKRIIKKDVRIVVSSKSIDMRGVGLTYKAQSPHCKQFVDLPLYARGPFMRGPWRGLS